MKSKTKAKELINKVQGTIIKFGGYQNYVLSEALALMIVEEILSIPKQKICTFQMKLKSFTGKQKKNYNETKKTERDRNKRISIQLSPIVV